MPIFYTKNVNKVYTKQRKWDIFFKKAKKTFANGAKKRRFAGLLGFEVCLKS